MNYMTAIYNALKDPKPQKLEILYRVIFGEYPQAYSQWAGNNKGVPPDYTKCAKRVYPKGSVIDKQCSKPRGHGKGQSYCKRHA